MKVLVVNLESNEAVVLQVKVDPKKLNDFIEETSAGHHRNRPTPREETAPQSRRKRRAGRSSFTKLGRYLPVPAG